MVLPGLCCSGKQHLMDSLVKGGCLKALSTRKVHLLPGVWAHLNPPLDETLIPSWHPLFLTLNPQLWVLLFSVRALSCGWLWRSESLRIINWLRVPLPFKITVDSSSILFLFNYSFIILNVVSQSDSFREEREKGGKEGEKKGRLALLHFQRQIYLQASVFPQLPTACYG